MNNAVNLERKLLDERDALRKERDKLRIALEECAKQQSDLPCFVAARKALGWN